MSRLKTEYTQVMLCVALLALTAIVSVTKIEAARNSSGCCGLASCYFTDNICANEYDCDYGPCCWTGCY